MSMRVGRQEHVAPVEMHNRAFLAQDLGQDLARLDEEALPRLVLARSASARSFSSCSVREGAAPSRRRRRQAAENSSADIIPRRSVSARSSESRSASIRRFSSASRRAASSTSVAAARPSSDSAKQPLGVDRQHRRKTCGTGIVSCARPPAPATAAGPPAGAARCLHQNRVAIVKSKTLRPCRSPLARATFEKLKAAARPASSRTSRPRPPSAARSRVVDLSPVARRRCCSAPRPSLR
jgi:hypothetical protein